MNSELVKTTYNFLYTTYIFESTSQKWRPDDVRPSTWKHWLTIVEPRLLGNFTEYGGVEKPATSF